jgi:antitoxin (DNA-binding transcriptional repressor) of toxin-antitoxin stability system
MRRVTMPSINLSQLRDTRRLKAWLKAGKTVELRERNRVIAHIVPERAPEGRLLMSAKPSWQRLKG